MPETSTKGLGFLTQKAGPLPLYAWLGIGGGLWWYFNKNKTSAAAGTAAGTAGTTGIGTDPAGNVGYIDPATGYVYGSAEDIAALQAQNSANSSGGTSGGSTIGGTSGGGATDTSGSANTGAPAGGPATTTPVPAPPATPSGGSTAANAKWSYPAPGGLRVSSVAAKGYYLNWNPVKGPNGQTPSSYTVATYNAKGTPVNQHTTSPGSTQTAEYGQGGGGLPAGTYHTNVWANGGPQAPPHATVTVTLKG